ncbi:hypothetical protein [Arthrobacter methylotrophus]|uniref:Uncharacterized protein n=1 Tax=Arthrobacter methylotrophus TaxID=121291 RepID=A0ABV5UPK2_9MICC
MTTETATAKPMFDHFVPEQEPPVGTVASFHYSFASGGGSSTGFMMRGAGGWSDSVNPQRHNTRSWEVLTDLSVRNSDIQKRNPGSTAVLTSVQVRIHAAPPADGPGARLAQLEEAIITAAERLGIRTEGASHAELVSALENLVVIARSA